jgi:hypothetical protein
MSDQVDPYSADVNEAIKELIDKLNAVRHTITRLGKVTNQTDAALMGKAADLVAKYSLAANDRHPTIRRSAETAAEEIKALDDSREAMATTYGVTANALRDKMGDLASDQLSATIQRLRDETSRIREMSGGSQALPRAVQNEDKETQQRIARYTALCGLAGTMIDLGHQYLDLNAARRAALEFYANGSRPKGWTRRLPEPVKRVFSEGTWTALEKVADKLGEEGIWHLTSPIPFSYVIVLPARVVWELNKERVQEQHAYRRGDVDELLDLADQLTMARGEAEALHGSVSTIAQAVPK